MNDISSLPHSKCTACAACFNICPVDAITMQSDENGFLFPTVQANCIDCDLCVKRCPELTPPKFSTPISCHAVWANSNARERGSSGGVFQVLSEYILSIGGAVCAAAFDNEFRNVSHTIVRDPTELPRLYKSKYVQSDINQVFLEIRDLLRKDKIPVLFCGCPCQVAGLKQFLVKDYDKLLLVDILCHGVPSPYAYQRFLDQVTKGHKGSVKRVDFRDKKYGWGKLVSVEEADGSVYYDPWNGDYLTAFQDGYSTREVCASCNYAKLERVGDITLGDFWGVKEIDSECDDKNGTSLVLCNTEKGAKVLGDVESEFDLFREVPIQTMMEVSRKTNGALVRPLRSNPMRNCFFHHLRTGDDFSTSLRYAQTSRLDVGIIGWWYETNGSNFGSTVTNYALYEFVKSLGLSVMLVALPEYNRDKAQGLNKLCRLSKSYPIEEMAENNKYVDTFLVGSDQLWYWDAFKKHGYTFLLDFADDTKKKIAYATSFGHNESKFPPEEIPVAEMYLQRFDAVSTREIDGVKICEETFHTSATQTVDPVFICDKDVYYRLAAKASTQTQERFLFAYILDPNEDKLMAIRHLTEKLGLKLVSVTDKQFNHKEKASMLADYGLIDNANCFDWIYHLLNAQYIVTDSFHGTCFSLVFEKPFVTFRNAARGDSRFATLETLFGIDARMITDPLAIIGNPVLLQTPDYEVISARVQREADRSASWLKNALFAEHKQSFPSTMQSILERVLRLEKTVAALQKEIVQKTSE